MYPELFTIPFINYPVKSYGFMLMIGFLSAIWMAARRAEKTRANPDVVINLGFCALIGGVIGARLMYVIHYWDRDFSDQSNSIMAALAFTRGGMEFLGGFVGAIILMIGYLIISRHSFRMYFDILIPGLMWGLAFGRVGCFLNGCCWGGVCAGTVAEDYRWSVQFPYGSPAHVRQLERRQLSLPAHLQSGGRPMSRKHVMMSQADRTAARRRYEKALDNHELMKQRNPDAATTEADTTRLARLKKAAEAETLQYRAVERILDSHPSSEFPGEKLTPTELSQMAVAHSSLAVHPAQLYGTINALLASMFLSVVFRVRRRHGVVFAVWLMTYPWTRIILERIRDDNPKDTFGLTISQFISVCMVAVGIAMFVAIRKMPEQSPCAKPWDPPEEGTA
jgi:phosphatidylglycerol:prolipoprotein diacylglycerol transferase